MKNVFENPCIYLENLEHLLLRDLSLAEKQCLCIIEGFMNSTINPDHLDLSNILCWTKLYQNRDIIIKECATSDKASIDFVRVLCCFLDRMRLKKMFQDPLHKSLSPSLLKLELCTAQQLKSTINIFQHSDTSTTLTVHDASKQFIFYWLYSVTQVVKDFQDFKDVSLSSLNCQDLKKLYVCFMNYLYWIIPNTLKKDFTGRQSNLEELLDTSISFDLIVNLNKFLNLAFHMLNFSIPEKMESPESHQKKLENSMYFEFSCKVYSFERSHTSDGIIMLIELVQATLYETWSRLFKLKNLFNFYCQNIITMARHIHTMFQFLEIPMREMSNENIKIKLIISEFTHLLESPLPLDVQSSISETNIKKVFHEWSNNYALNKKRQQEIDDTEKAKVRASECDFINREKLQRATLNYVKQGIILQQQLRTKNPFFILGLNPSSLNEEQLNRTKKRLMLLLHPDKCINPDLASEMNIIFKLVLEAIDFAKDLYQTGRHLGFLGPSSIPPFNDDMHIKSNNEFHKKHKTKVEDVIWLSYQFKKFTDFTKLFFQNDSTPKPAVLTESCQTIIKNTNPTLCRLRLYISRPYYISSDKIDAPYKFKTSLMNYLLKKDECELKYFVSIIETSSPTIEFSKWIALRSEVLQPVLEEDIQGTALCVAVHQVDYFNNRMSDLYWFQSQTCALIVPSGKSRLISLIRLFENAPDYYKCYQNILPFFESCSTFPSVKYLNGQTTKTLINVLSTLIKFAMKAEKSLTTKTSI